MMHKKDFTAIADVLYSSRFTMSEQDYETLVKRMTTVCADTNPRFSRLRFWDACGLDENGHVARKSLKPAGGAW